MIHLDDSILSENVVSPMVIGFHSGVHFFIVSRVLMDNI
jgi:hypothetical protein